MRTSYVLIAALGLLLLGVPGAYALGVSPAHPGFDDGTQAPRVQDERGGPTLRVATIENINTTVTYSTIQAAHDAATPGDTLEVQGSPHTEGPQITITKGITLRGQTGSEVILAGADTIDDGGDGRAWFLVTGANLTVKDLNFDGSGFKIYQGFRIKAGGENPSFDNCSFNDMIFPPYAGTAVVQFSSDGMSVTDCTFTNIGRQGIFFFGTSVTSGVASGNVYTGKGAGDWLDYGIEIGGGAVATCTNNTITNNVGVALSDGSTSAAVIITTYFGAGTGGVLSGNFLNSCTGAIAAGFDGADVSVITATDNDMSGNVTYTVNNTSTTVVNDCSGNWWGSNVPATVAAGFTGAGGVDYTPWLDVGTDTDGGTDGFQGDFSTLNVDDDSPQTGATGRVQEGAELVTASTVNVGPGTYVEQILIDGKDITLQGAGCGSSFIHSPATLTTTFTTSDVNKPIITVTNSANTVIDGFTIDGLGLGNANFRMVGLGYWNAGGAITNCCIQNIINTPFAGSQHGNGILAANDSGGPYSLEVGNCTVIEFQKTGMVLTGAGMTFDVHDCTVTGKGYTTVIAQNGIQGGYGASGTVRDNVLSDIGWIGTPWAAGGLLMISGGTIDATGNHTITDVQVPVWWQDTSGSVEGVNASGQLEYGGLIYNLTSPLPFRDQGPPVQVSPVEVASEAVPTGMRSVVSFTMTESCLDGTTASTPFVGIYGYSAGASLVMDVTNTSINGWDYGIVADGAATSLTATSNDISGNTSAGYDNTLSGAAQTATFNWWGAADGPSGDGSGSGDAVASVGGEVGFDPYLTDGTSSTSCAFTPADNVVEPNPALGICISGPTPCVSVPIDITRNDNADMRGFSVTFSLSSSLMLCAGTSSITEGTYLSNLPSSSTVFQILDNTGGSYTVDGALLGLPCGQTDPSGTLFDIAVKASGGDGSGTITIDSVLLRDCANAPLPAAAGAAAVIPIDTAGPAAVGDIAAVQVKTGNDLNETTEVSLTFGVPGDATVTEVYRAPYSLGTVNAYPEYDDIVGAGPPATPSYPPPAPWTATAVTSSPDTDEPTDRGYWYYVVFTKDACGNVSAVSNVAGGVLNYHLGDVAPGLGDSRVTTALDMTLLGANYGITLAHLDALNFLDVGPTSDFSVDALPQTDDEVEFEDLMMFAINHGVVSGPAAIPVAIGVVERPDLVLRVNEGSPLTARLVLRNHESAVKGVHSLVAFDRDALELVSVTQGGLVDGAFFATLDHEDGVIVDAAVMGNGLTFTGAGEVAELTFRRKQEGAAPSLALADLRGVNNRPLGDLMVADGPPASSSSPEVAAATPTTLQLVGARPNPFRGSTEIVFRLPDSRPVSVSIYDVSGRLVRTLTDRTLPAGEHRATWDGRAADGSRAGAGIYFYAFRAGDRLETRKLLHVR